MQLPHSKESLVCFHNSVLFCEFIDHNAILKRLFCEKQRKTPLDAHIRLQMLIFENLRITGWTMYSKIL
jgi:hypothetical protein|tara:strand:+ start:1101 stop:1307 length:207 start_codon:yes stop_codon:yes gene_type:complete